MADPLKQDGDRGRESTRPQDIPKPGWRDILLRTKNQISKDNVDLVAAGVALYGLLAIFPAIAALVSIYGLIADPAQVQQQLGSASGLIPGGAQSILGDQMHRVSSGSTGALSVATAVSIILAFWSASKGTKAFMAAMNIAYDEDERRGFIKLNLVAFALTLFVILLAILALIFIVAAPAFLGNVGLGPTVKWLITFLRWPVIALVFIFALAVLYCFAPSRDRPQWRWVSPGSVAAVVLWLIASIAFSAYVRNFGTYNETYGSLGAAAAMIVWFWLSAYVVILGAELNSEMERQTRRDTTAGKREPLGERGAHAADTVGERP